MNRLDFLKDFLLIVSTAIINEAVARAFNHADKTKKINKKRKKKTTRKLASKKGGSRKKRK